MITKKRATKLSLISEVERVGDANTLLKEPGQVVIVKRGSIRSIVFSCPDGCGELLTINLDPRAGKAWRLYKTNHGITLFPSVWRDNGCGSHFIVWRDKILWLGFESDYSQSSINASNQELELRIVAVLTNQLRSYLDIADELNEIPWDVLYSCKNLVKKDMVKCGLGKQQDWFKK
jgi:Family of unknown function (DUF6527)